MTARRLWPVLALQAGRQANAHRMSSSMASRSSVCTAGITKGYIRSKLARQKSKAIEVRMTTESSEVNQPRRRMLLRYRLLWRVTCDGDTWLALR